MCVWEVAACPSDKARGAGPVLPDRSHIQIRADNIQWKNCCRLETAQTTHNAMCVLEQLYLCVCVCVETYRPIHCVHTVCVSSSNILHMGLSACLSTLDNEGLLL